MKQEQARELTTNADIEFFEQKIKNRIKNAAENGDEILHTNLYLTLGQRNYIESMGYIIRNSSSDSDHKSGFHTIQW